MGQVQKKGRVRARHDAFMPKKRRLFYKALRKTGCLADAARKAGISRETARRWRRKDARFAYACERALEIAAVDLEAIAYERGVYGAEQVTIRNGEVVEVKRKPSDAMLRLLLIGSNRKKYGRLGAVGKRRLEAWERKRIEKEVRARIAAEDVWSFDEAMEVIDRKLISFQNRQVQEGTSVRLHDGTVVERSVLAALGFSPERIEALARGGGAAGGGPGADEPYSFSGEGMA